MNPSLQRLAAIAAAPSRLIVGLMSGTSLDGLDVVLCRFSGSGRDTRAELLAFETVGYDDTFREKVRKVFAARQADVQDVCLLNAHIGRVHADMVLRCLRQWAVEPMQVDIIASHGQTIFHAPARQHGLPDMPNATLQIGDGDHIAQLTGIITLSDFRQKHVAGGGEGAPLALYGDYLLFSSPDENRILLNIGGIANFTLLPRPGFGGEAYFATDTGPGNTLMDALAQRRFGLPFDEDGRIAAQGRVSDALLTALKQHPYFRQSLPKTTGPEVFNPAMVQDVMERVGIRLSAEDEMATLCRFTAECIADDVRACIGDAPFGVYVSGGGAHHPVLRAHLRDLLPNCTIHDFEVLGISGDAKEAVLFAALANETLAGGATQLPGSTAQPAVTMGKISLPG